MAEAIATPRSTHDLRGDYSRMAPDYTVAQDMSAYRTAEHALWQKLYRRQIALMPRYAYPAVTEALLALDAGRSIPDLAAVSRSLRRATGWELAAVPGLVPDEVFFAHLAARRFPVTIWLRTPEEVDYLVEPDIFHDFFGHVPLLFNPVFADFMQLYGEKGREARELGAVEMLARLYWFTVEFGLIRTPAGLRAIGAGILSSHAETVFAIDDASPNRIAFDLERVMRTRFRIDDFQESYFALEDLDSLFAALQSDLPPLYGVIAKSEPLAPAALLPDDRLHHRGTQVWAKTARRREA